MKFQNTYAALGHKFCAHQLPTIFANPRLVKFNDELAADLGVEFLRENAAQFLSGNQIPDGCEPIAQAYAGHQFGHLNILGDGRAILLGEIETPNGLFDMVLKGAGRTPYSRGGDGCAALGPVMREYIVSEAMNKLGVPTTRALGFVLTGEHIMREDILQGAVLTRIAQSHIRVGTFVYFAVHREFGALKQLADYVIKRHYPDAQTYAHLLQMICTNQAKLIAKWMSIGFIHGVMNTDNMAISGETIDYGPCAFMDEYNPSQTYSFIDKRGRYQYQNQPAIGAWNLARLAEAFLPLLDENQDKAVEIANEIIAGFQNEYQKCWLNEFARKIGIENPNAEDADLINQFLAILHEHNLDFTNSFIDLGNDNLASAIFGDFLYEWENRVNRVKAREIMKQTNPQIIPRNHHIAKAIEAGENGDFSKMERLINAYSKPFEYNESYQDLYSLPREIERVENTFCGT